MEETTIDAAKSNFVFGVADRLSTPESAAWASFLDQELKGQSPDYSVEDLKRCQAVKKEDMIRCLQDYILKLFKPESSIAYVVTTPGKLDEITEELGKRGFQVDNGKIEVQDDEHSEDESISNPERSKTKWMICAKNNLLYNRC